MLTPALTDRDYSQLLLARQNSAGMAGQSEEPIRAAARDGVSVNHLFQQAFIGQPSRRAIGTRQ
jgi:hypothetical protein